MGQLRTLQEELSRILFIGAENTTSPLWKDGIPKRIQVYKNTVHGNCYDTLDSDFPMTQKQFSEDDWFDLSKAFFTKHRPAYWELNKCVEAFPAFLKKQKVKPWIPDLADYEASDLIAYIDLAVVKKGLGRSNPTARPRIFQHQIFDWALQKAKPTLIPAQKPEVVVFYRDTKHGGRIRRADPLMLLLLDHFSQPGAELEDAEEIRAKLLPQNHIPLDLVLDDLIKSDLVLI